MTEPTKRFSGLASVYAAGRPTYPEDSIDFIIGKCRLTAESTVADIGCGTGISSRLFAERGVKVIGIEPNDDMRGQAEAHDSQSNPSGQAGQSKTNGPKYMKGDAEATGLGPHCVDAVLAAQAFHWFRAQEAINEFCRVLKPDGWIILIWNERNTKDLFTEEYGKLINSFPDTSKVEMHRRKAGEALLINEQVKNGSLSWFENCQQMDWQGFQQRAFSTSYAPKESPDKDIFVEGLASLYEKYQSGGNLVMHYETSVYLAQPR